MSKFDEILNQIRDEAVDPAVASEAGERVRQNLFGPGAAAVDNLHGCDDFRSLIPAYLQRTLSDARRMLLEDHTHACVPCRQALDRARSGGRAPVAMPVRQRPYSDLSKWAIAAAILIGFGLTAAITLSYLPFLGGTAAEVQAVNGTLYRVASRGSVPLGAGQDLSFGDDIRTPAGSTAMVKLFDGSRIEMNERAELSVTRGWRGTTIHLERGHIIVQAARQKLGRLHVATGDGTVTVKGTIFSVNRGSVGTRVSVVEGEVQVDHGGRTESLKPGDQTTTNPALAPSSVSSEIAWSQDSSRYFALLGEFHALQRRFEAIPGQGLRYSSRLLLFVPDDTLLFASIPNI
jgi:FecR protein/Putative zinc-finger